MYKSFTGKVILFGEYSVITGSKALVIPLKLFSGNLALPGDLRQDGREEQEAKRSHDELRRFLSYLAFQQDNEKLSLKLDTGLLGKDLDLGLHFLSSIPYQYGAGSSAALVAAVYDAYAFDKIRKKTEDARELSGLRKGFSEMESHFHGTSSGIDPLCSYLGRSIVIDAERVMPVSISPIHGDGKLFLFDSGLKGDTGMLVSEFKSRLAGEADFARIINNDLSSLVERGIECLSGATKERLKDVFWDLSQWQLEHFGSMIPERVKRIWIDGLERGVYASKLCGSGGGGFFIAYTEQWEETQSLFTRSGMEILPLDL